MKNINRLTSSLFRNKKILSFGIYSTLFYLSFYLVDYFRTKGEVFGFVFRSSAIDAIVVAIFLFLVVYYFKAIKSAVFEKIDILSVVILSLIFHLIVVFIWPLLSTDVYSYISLSRIISHYHENPYLVPYSEFPQDPFFTQLTTMWSDHRAYYGPVFMIIGGFITSVSGDSLYLSLLIFKLVFVTANVLNAYLIYKITDRVFPALVYAWNPLLILNFSLDGHNDVVGVFFFLLSLYYMRKGKNIFTNLVSFAFLILAFLVKIYFLIFIPLFLLTILRRLRSIREVIVFLFYAFALGSLVLVGFYFPFFEGKNIFSHYSYLFSLTMVNTSPGILFFSKIFSHFQLGDIKFISTSVSQALFIALSVGVFLRLLKDKGDLLGVYVKYCLMMSFYFFFFYVTWLWSWYLTILFALIAISVGIGRRHQYLKYHYFVMLWGYIYHLIF